MMNRHPDELISASLTGDLTPAERADLDRHLGGCGRCRDTLEAFSEERRLVGGLHEVPVPRDLAARVRSGVETGRLVGAPWWRRPSTLVASLASLATVAAALLVVVLLSRGPQGPTGTTPLASASASLGASPTLQPTPEPTAEPTPAPPVAIGPGQLGYLQLDGAPGSDWQLSFANDETGVVTDLGTTGGPPLAAAISPTNEFIAYVVELGASGANQVRLTRLADGMTRVLGCTLPRPFGDRLAWSGDGRYLAYTLTAIEVGATIDCGGIGGDGSRTDVFVYDAAATGEPVQLTDAGNAFLAGFAPSTGQAQYPILVSYAATDPYSEEIAVASDAEPVRIDGAFMPLLSPDGQLALLWRGTMAQAVDGTWRFTQGGLPYVTSLTADGLPDVDAAEPFFPDLVPVGGAAFESGQLGWSEDGTLAGFWGGDWTGTPQSADGSAPTSKDIYVRQVIGGSPDAVQRVPIDLADDERVVDVAFHGSAGEVLVTVARDLAGDLSVPEATLYVVPLSGDALGQPGTGASWTGPAIFGREAVALP